MIGDLEPEIGDRPFTLADKSDLPGKPQLFQGRGVNSDDFGHLGLFVLAIEQEAIFTGNLAAQGFNIEIIACRHPLQVPPACQLVTVTTSNKHLALRRCDMRR